MNNETMNRKETVSGDSNSMPLELQHLLEDFDPVLMERALASTAEGITISDARLPDNPIVYVNEGFVRLTGYSREDILGRNCRFLQGIKSDPASVDSLRQGIREGETTTVELLNYKKDGTPFWTMPPEQLAAELEQD